MKNGVQSERAFNSGVDAENPWPGLVAFTEELQQFFYGREDEADELLRRVGGKNLTVLFGQSGLGKSSLLQAGLFPRLRAARLHSGCDSARSFGDCAAALVAGRHGGESCHRSTPAVASKKQVP